MKKHYIELNNRNTLLDFGLDMLDRKVDPADVKRATSELPHAQGILDFSLGSHNEIFFKERPLMWEFGRKVANKAQAENLRYDIMRWIYSFTDGIIKESQFPSMHYRNASCTNLFFPENKGNYFVVRMEFMAYPLRRSELLEGSKLWDSFNFNTDVWQTTKYRIPSILDQLPFIDLPIGEMVTLGGWSQYRPGSNSRFYNYETERSYEIIDKRDANDVDYDKSIYSGIQYQIEDNSWVRAQDIVQARRVFTEATLWNVGTNPVIPDIVQRVYGQPTIAGITVELNGQFYNYHRIAAGQYKFNDKLALPVGKNKLKLYGQGMEVDFQFRKEVP